MLNQSNAVVENTIREIREAQAEKERTREVRQELNAFRSALNETDHEKDDAIERKMQQIIARKQRQEQRKKDREEQKGKPRQQSQLLEKPQEKREVWQPGMAVSIKGQTTTGVLETIKGKKGTVLFGAIRTTLPLDMLESASAPKEKAARTVATNTYISRQTLNQMHQTQLNFNPEIDIRGMRGEEALQTITRYIDDAILVGAARVRILHGTGSGYLRQIIRQYLNTVPQVQRAHDEHVQFGGAGITVVEFRS